MKILKKYGLVFVFVLASPSAVYGLFDCKQYKGLLTVFNEENKELSPVYGALAYASDFLENIYNWAPDQWPTYVLAHQLFNIRIDKTIGQVIEAFHVSGAMSNPVKSFDGALIGEIIVWLKKGQPSDKVEKIIYTMQKKHKAFFISQKKSGKQITGAKAKEYLKVIAKSYCFDSKVTLMMLTSVLYLKQNIKKQEMIDYLQALRNGLGDDIFAEPLTGDEEARILDQAYTSEELEISDTEESKMVSSMRSETCFSPEVLQGSYGFAGQCSVSNCVETALNDWFNLLLYDADKKIFNLQLLPESIRSSLSFANSAFGKFYKKYNTPEKINSNEVQQAFMDMVSAIKGVVYIGGKNYEIEPEVDNMLMVVNELLGIHADSWENVCEMLSTEERKITKIASSLNEIAVEIGDHSDNKIVFTLKIAPKYHARLECEMRGNVVHYNLGDYIGNGNKHCFFTFNIKNKDIGVSSLCKIVSLEDRLTILKILLQRNYYGNDVFFKHRMVDISSVFTLDEMEESLDNSTLFASILEYIVSLDDSVGRIIWFFKRIMSPPGSEFEKKKIFCGKIIQALPVHLFAMKNALDETIFGCMLWLNCYELAELCIRSGGDKVVFSLSNNTIEKKILKNLIKKSISIDEIERRQAQFLLSCPALSYEALKEKNMYPVKVFYKFQETLHMPAIGYTKDHFNVYEDVLDESFYDKRLEAIDWLLQLMAEKKVDSNDLEFLSMDQVTILDRVIEIEALMTDWMNAKTKEMLVYEKERKAVLEANLIGESEKMCEMYIRNFDTSIKEYKDRYYSKMRNAKREQQFLMDLIRKLREVGAKTAVELEEETVRSQDVVVEAII